MLVFSFVPVSALESTPISDGGFNIGNWLSHLFGGKTFSVVGVTRQCSEIPNKEITVAYLVSFPASSVYCDNALTNIFDTNWNTLGEYKDSNAMVCDDPDGCIVQYYCCPHPECESDSDCEDWYGLGSDCKSKIANDPNIYYESGQNFKYCKAPEDTSINCYYYDGIGAACKSVEQLNTCPSTYMSYTLYDTKSECEDEEEDEFQEGDLGVQTGITMKELQSFTSQDLVKSMCTSIDQCKEGNCLKVNYLEEQGLITSAKTEAFFEDGSKLFLTGTGLAIGTGACLIVAGAATITTGGFGSVLFPICSLIGLGGAGVGLAADTAFNEIADAFSSGNKNKAGFCITDDEDNSLDKYLERAAFFDVDRNGTKNGVDGLIILAGLLVLFSFVLKK